METYTVELTAAEINALQICITAEHMILQNEVTQLESHNETGMHDYKIEHKRNCMKVCDRLWDKLYNAEV